MAEQCRLLSERVMASHPKMVHSGVFTPDDVKAVSDAFEDAWSALHRAFDNEAAETAVAARVRLANAILTARRMGETETPRLAAAGLRAMKPVSIFAE
jgi:hypothetical protein